MEAKKALETAKGNIAKAKEVLQKMGLEKAAKRADKTAAYGQVFSYIHHSGQVGSLVVLMSETDFVASNADFSVLGKELAMQIASMEPKNVTDLLAQAYIRDPKKTINDLVTELSSKCKEKIVIREFARFNLK